MAVRTTHRISANALRDLMERMVVAAGCDEETAKTVADVHVEADMRGHLFQGLDHMFDLILGIQAGEIDPKGKPEVAKEGDAWVLVDGNRGAGHPAAVLGAKIGINKARSAGSCTIGITNSSDIYIIGYYVEILARAGMVGILTTNGGPLVHPYGGIEPILGTNPIAIGIPTDSDDPIVLDMATSAIAGSYIRQAAYYGEQIPQGVAIDEKGMPTTDSADIDRRLGGAGTISPMAGHKGFGLGLCLAIMAGPLVGAEMGRALEGDTPKGHIMMAINPEIFGDTTTFKKWVSRHLQDIKTSKKAPGVSEILIPGERSFAQRERSLKEGIELLDATWQRAEAIAGSLGIELPK